jgi:predicted DNA-binding transcriptional regulator AlpA
MGERTIVFNDGENPMQAQKSGSADDELLLPAEIAKLLKVSLSWLAKARLAGNGPAFVKIGRSIRYRRSAVQDYIRARTKVSTSQA